MNSTNAGGIDYSREELERKLKERKKKFASVTTAFEKDLFSKMINHYESLIKKIDEDDEKKRKELVMKLKEYKNLFKSATMAFEKDCFRKAIDHYKSLIKKIDDKKGTENSEIENIPRCVICLDNSNKNREFMFKCGHSFHGECVTQWLRNNRTCPTCRAVIDPYIAELVKRLVRTPDNSPPNMITKFVPSRNNDDYYNTNQEYEYMFRCGHSFHINGINQWLQNNRTCPTCRTSISLQTIEYWKLEHQSVNGRSSATYFLNSRSIY
jgi:hypothetical protein